MEGVSVPGAPLGPDKTIDHPALASATYRRRSYLQPGIHVWILNPTPNLSQNPLVIVVYPLKFAVTEQRHINQPAIKGHQRKGIEAQHRYFVSIILDGYHYAEVFAANVKQPF